MDLFYINNYIGNNTLKNKKWNYCLILFLIVDIYYIALYLYDNVPTFIQGIGTYLQNMTSSLDVVVLVALITGSITLLNSFYSRYSEQKNKKRECVRINGICWNYCMKKITANFLKNNWCLYSRIFNMRDWRRFKLFTINWHRKWNDRLY